MGGADDLPELGKDCEENCGTCHIQWSVVGGRWSETSKYNALATDHWPQLCGTCHILKFRLAEVVDMTEMAEKAVLMRNFANQNVLSAMFKSSFERALSSSPERF